MRTSFTSCELKKVSSKNFFGRFSLIVPIGTGTTIASFLRNILISDFPSFGIKSVVISTSEFQRTPDSEKHLSDIIENLKKIVFCPKVFFPIHKDKKIRIRKLKTEFICFFNLKKNDKKIEQKYFIKTNLIYLDFVLIKKQFEKSIRIIPKKKNPIFFHQQLFFFENNKSIYQELNYLSELSNRFTRKKKNFPRNITFLKKTFPFKSTQTNFSLLKNQFVKTYYKPELSSKNFFLKKKISFFSQLYWLNTFNKLKVNKIFSKETLSFPFARLDFTKKNSICGKDIQIANSLKIVNPNFSILNSVHHDCNWKIWMELGFDFVLPRNHIFYRFFSETIEKDDLKKKKLYAKNLFSNQFYKLDLETNQAFSTFESKNRSTLQFVSKQFFRKNFFLKIRKQKLRFLFSICDQPIKTSICFLKQKKIASKISIENFQPWLSRPYESFYEFDCRPMPSIVRKANFSIHKINSRNEKISFELYTTGSLSPVLAFQYARLKAFDVIQNCFSSELVTSA